MFRLGVVVAIAAVLAMSCSSTTTMVERADRPTDTTTSSDAPAGDQAADDDMEEDAADEDSTEDAADDATDEQPVTSDDQSDDAGEDADEDNEEEAGFGLGGAVQLASLLADCEADSDQACDILFQLSAVDSIEEAAALSCGGRSETETPFCTEGVEADGEQLHFDESSPGLSQIVIDCEGGDMTACDFLYYRSPLGSTYEETGNSCGGRTDVALPDCRTFFDD